MNVKDTVNLAIINLEPYVKDSRESILTGARGVVGDVIIEESEKDFKNRKRTEKT